MEILLSPFRFHCGSLFNNAVRALGAATAAVMPAATLVTAPGEHKQA